MFRILVLVSIVGLCAVPSYGVESFVEMFRGTGPYAGLDNPGWKVSSLGGDDEFTEDGFRIISESLTVDDVQLTVASRDVFDASSFTETLTFKELTFRPPVEDIAHNVVSFSHIMNTSRFSGPESITWIISPRFEDGVEDWSLGMLVEGTPGLGARIPVANEFSVRTTFSESTRMATFVYEYTRDGVSSSIVFGPLQYGGRITNEQRTIASVGANDRGFVAATLHEWTLQPLSDVKGDYDGNGQLGVADIVLLSHAIGTQSTDAIFDLNGDGVLNDQDLGVWIRDLG
ncbi:MAG: hypothetical protein KDB23_31810, partial [Planctomycetales bacterium]|nr:hypothetical protein [Planctomycetales bacterium]